MLLMVDAISIQGGDKLPVDDWNVDICVTASQKCLMTPPGLAFISVSEKACTKIESKKVNRSYYLDLQMYNKYIEDVYTPFTPAVSLLCALSEACYIILDAVPPARCEQHRSWDEAV